MMQTHSNFSLYIVAASFAALLLCLPIRADAFTLPSLGSRVQQGAAAVVNTHAICTRLSALDGTIATRIKATSAAYEREALTRESRTITALASKDKDTAERAAADKKLAAYIRSLERQAGGDTLKKQAVASFAKEVRAAADTRRAAIDAAARAYRDGVVQASRARVHEVKTIGEQLRADLSNVVGDSATRCRGGVEGTLVRDELNASLASIERDYRTKFSDKKELFGQLSVLATTRAEAIVEADRAFTASLDASSQALRSVLQ